MTENNKTTSNVATLNLILLVLYIVFFSNMTEQQSIEYNIQEIYNYLFVKTILACTIVAVTLLGLCGILGASSRESPNEGCTYVILVFMTLVYSIGIIIGLVFTYMLVSNNSSVRKYQLTNKTDTIATMGQIIAFISITSDYIVTFILGCSLITASCTLAADDSCTCACTNPCIKTKTKTNSKTNSNSNTTPVLQDHIVSSV